MQNDLLRQEKKKNQEKRQVSQEGFFPSKQKRFACQ